jgi:hypothetical protein
MDKLITELFIARAKAINYYANYEAVLAILFAQLMEVPIDYAGVPFFKIQSAPARLDIIQRLIEKRHGHTHKKFWESLQGKLRVLDADRNHLVHWVVLTHVGTSHKICKVTLTEPNVMDRKANTNDKTVEWINEFSARCKFFNGLIGAFNKFITKKESVPDAWHDIFLQQVDYPPKDSHPLSQKKKELEIPPLPSSE